MNASTRVAPLLVLLLTVGACSSDGGTEPTPATTTEVTTETTTAVESVTVEVTTTTGVTPVPASTTALASAPDCDAEAFRGDFTEPVVMYCDGEWARAGQAFTDHLIVYRAEDGRWVHYEPHGRSAVTEYPCFDEAALLADGVPAELRGTLSVCQD